MFRLVVCICRQRYRTDRYSHYDARDRPVFLPGVGTMLPVMRDQDGYSAYREWSGGLLAGAAEPRCKPVFHDGIPKPFEFELLPNDWDHFRELIQCDKLNLFIFCIVMPTLYFIRACFG